MNKHKNTTSQAANRHNRSCHRILPRLSMPSERSRTLCLINKCTSPISLRMFFHGNGIHNKILRSIFLLFTWWITNSWWKKTRVPVGIGNSHSIKFDMSALIIQVYSISNNDTLFSKYDWIGNYSFKTFILKGDILLCLISLSQDNLVLVGVLTFTIYITAPHLTLEATKVQSFANPFY